MKTDEPIPKKRRWTVYGILAGFIIFAFILSMPGGGPGLAAFKMAASNEASQIVIACQSYQVEYGALPQTSENYRLTKILCGDNPRKIEFLSLKPRQLSSNGEDIDPWKTPFRITFDSDSKVHVISAGPDKIFGTPDDISNQ